MTRIDCTYNDNMPANIDHHRRSIRLPGYDYSQSGAYFVTFVSCKRELLFGEIQDGQMILNPFGQIVAEEWLKTPVVRPNIELGEYIIMPDHIHGIIIIHPTGDVGAMRRIAPTSAVGIAPTSAVGIAPTSAVGIAPTSAGRIAPTNPNGAAPGSIGAILGQIKSITTKRINAVRGTPGIPVWQRNYFEHIIRSEAELDRISEYIRANSINWETDRENQKHI